jgi:hypothetical protein
MLEVEYLAPIFLALPGRPCVTTINLNHSSSFINALPVLDAMIASIITIWKRDPILFKLKMIIL